MKIKNLTIIFALFMVLLCCFSAVSASEDVTDDSIAVSDDVAMDEVVGEVDSGDESISVENENEVVSEGDSEVLGDWEHHDVIYVNISSANDVDDDNVNGSSWDNAYGGTYSLSRAMQNINDDGTIYVAEGTYKNLGRGQGLNYVVIGMDREKTILGGKTFQCHDKVTGTPNTSSARGEHTVATFINLTFTCTLIQARNEKVFINCTFINVPINSNYNVYNVYANDPSEFDTWGVSESFVTNFTNCKFVNYTQNLLNAYTTAKVNFNNCTFVNVTTDSIATHTGDFILEDSLNFYRCTFNNVNVKGIVDVPTGANLGEHYNIEYCEGVDDFGVIADGEHNYINSTKSKSETNLVSSVDKDGNLLINLTSVDGSDMANETVSISVNGGEFTNHTLGDNGILSIPVKSLTNLTGKVTIVVFYGDNDYYIGNMSKTEYVIPIATNMTADDLTTEVNVVKYLNVILKDINGKPLAGKEIKITAKNKNLTVNTTEEGVAIIPISQDTAGVYEYTLFFGGDEYYKNSTKIVKVTISEAKKNESSTQGKDSNTTVKKVNPVATKITAKKKTTFKAKKKSKKYSITLKAGKKTVSKVKVTIKVGKKTYKTTTNKKGKATFNLKKLTKKGKYNAVIKFAGNSKYKASTKKVKIIIK